MYSQSQQYYSQPQADAGRRGSVADWFSCDPGRRVLNKTKELS